VSALNPRIHVLRVIYDGPDREAVAAQVGLSVSALIDAHQEPTYRALQLGFLPGFAYLGPVPARLHVPRLAQPRPRVAAHSVGLAAGFTGVYPLASPGGWNLLGRMIGPPLFDPRTVPPTRLRVGDAVRFEAVGDAEDRASEVPIVAGLAGGAAIAEGLVVSKMMGLATVQDGLRRGFLGDGVPEGGPLDREALVAANLAVGNVAEAAAIEVARGTLVLEALGRPLDVSVNGAMPIRLGIGESLVVAAPDSPRIVAIAGGLSVEALLGSRSTCLPGAFGGLEGRPLRRGDRLALEPGERTSAGQGSTVQEVKTLDQVVIPVEPSPMDDDGEAFAALLKGSFRLGAQSNRVGQRLEGPPLPRRLGHELAPRPMVRGAIQVTHDGTPVVLGPDHPTTGGDPVVGQLDDRAMTTLGRLRVGGGVRFVKRKDT
jgi:allophanate hydrolase subunit 2